MLAMLENSVSKVQNVNGSLDFDDIGRFLSVSGLKFQYNKGQPPGSRVVRAWIEVFTFSIPAVSFHSSDLL